MQQLISPYGYYTDYGYKGLVGNRYMLFATEAEYIEYLANVAEAAETD